MEPRGRSIGDYCPGGNDQRERNGAEIHVVACLGNDVHALQHASDVAAFEHRAQGLPGDAQREGVRSGERYVERERTP